MLLYFWFLIFLIFKWNLFYSEYVDLMISTFGICCLFSIFRKLFYVLKRTLCSLIIGNIFSMPTRSSFLTVLFKSSISFIIFVCLIYEREWGRGRYLNSSLFFGGLAIFVLHILKLCLNVLPGKFTILYITAVFIFSNTFCPEVCFVC